MTLAAGPMTQPDRRLAPAVKATEKAPNPHWRDEDCRYCHTLGPGQRAAEAPKDVDALCLGCHDGRKARAERHPLGMTPVEARPPTDWPTSAGRLGCLTCHDARRACGRGGGRPAFNPVFLRLPPTGSTVDAFCQRCHSPARYRRLNPHVMVNSSGALLADRCLTCHRDPPDRSARTRTGQAGLRDEPPALCKSCHRVHSDFYQPGHLGAVVSPTMLDYIGGREAFVLQARLARQTGRATSQPDANESACPLPLGPGNKIICTTCHNPHQQGTFSADSVLSHRAMRLVGPDRAARPGGEEALCADCHDTASLMNRRGR